MKASNTAKGILIGLAAGVVATAAKTIYEHYFPVRDEDTPPPSQKLADEVSIGVTGTEVQPEKKAVVADGIGWLISTLSAAGQSLLADNFKLARTGLGLPLGTAIWTATHGTTMPALGLEKSVSEEKFEFARNRIFSYLIYTLVISVARKGLVRALK